MSLSPTDPRLSPDPRQLRAEAARYALLRRLAPSMRHHLVVNLQPIGMIYEVLDRRLRAPEPKLADLHDSAQKINGFARAALDSSLDVITWLAPEDGVGISLTEGVNECLRLVQTSFTFRGYALRNEVVAMEGELRRSAMRAVLTGALVHLADVNPAPAAIHLYAEPAADGVTLVLRLGASDAEPGFNTAPAYRPLGWDDLLALAEADGVPLEREPGGALRFTLPRSVATAA